MSLQFPTETILQDGAHLGPSVIPSMGTHVYNFWLPSLIKIKYSVLEMAEDFGNLVTDVGADTTKK